MAAEVEALVATRGDALRDRMVRVEVRLSEIAAAASAPVDALAGETIAAGGKRLRPLLVLLAGGDPAGDDTGLIRAAVAVELIALGHAGARRRARRRPAAPRPAHRVGHGGPRRRDRHR